MEQEKSKAANIVPEEEATMGKKNGTSTQSGHKVVIRKIVRLREVGKYAEDDDTEVYAIDGDPGELLRWRPDEPPVNRIAVSVGCVGTDGEPILVYREGQYRIVPSDGNNHGCVGQVWLAWRETPIASAQRSGDAIAA